MSGIFSQRALRRAAELAARLNPNLIAGLGMALVCCLGFAAQLGITPTTIQFGDKFNRTVVSVVNYGTAPVTMQADAVQWLRVNGRDEERSTNALVLAPAIFTIGPGETQIVRVGLRQAGQKIDEAKYRVLLREVSAAGEVAADATPVRLAAAQRVPVYVAPARVVEKEHWDARRDASGNIVASIRNAGNVHYKIGKVNLRGENRKEGMPAASASLGAVLFPGEEKSFPLRLSQPLPETRQVTLEVFTNRGVQYVALNLPEQ